LADRFIVVVDTSRLTYPDYGLLYWTFDSDTGKGYAWTDNDEAHRLAKAFNDDPDNNPDMEYGWTRIVGWP